jgi:hypothetical protein
VHVVLLPTLLELLRHPGANPGLILTIAATIAAAVALHRTFSR